MWQSELWQSPLEPTASLSRWRLPPAPLLEEAPVADARSLAFPNGQLPKLSCAQARRIVRQAGEAVAAPQAAIDPEKFASATSDWLDPHGLWSVAPDSPIGDVIRTRASRLLREIESSSGEHCPTAREIGTELTTWSLELRAILKDARERARREPRKPGAGWISVSATPFEDGPVMHRARSLAAKLGSAAGTAETAFGATGQGHATALLDRATPDLSPEMWEEVLLAAAVRAYVPQLDPHGAWAPLDEETSIYDMSLESDPPQTLWLEMTRTSLGVRVDRGAHPPLRDGDIVLQIRDVSLAGMSVEQAGQLSVLTDPTPIEVLVVRKSEAAPLALTVDPHAESEVSSVLRGHEPGRLDVSLAPYGDGTVAVISLPDVPDDLGDLLSDALSSARAEAKLTGVLLDLRGNGGGSTDGAIAALGLFLPGATLFPMRRRDGTVEVDRAPVPSEELTWRGPLAALVDGGTASAAEMIAGALGSYKRAVLIGGRTFGKGCAQEYLDDETTRGVLRLTTLVFSLPDGQPLQQVGVKPQVLLDLPAVNEREAALPHAFASWVGPDVRERALIASVPWPTTKRSLSSRDAIGRALRLLGTERAASR